MKSNIKINKIGSIHRLHCICKNKFSHGKLSISELIEKVDSFINIIPVNNTKYKVVIVK